MEELETMSDRGGVLVGTKDFGVLIPNGYGDGDTRIYILNSEERLRNDVIKNLKYFNCIEGKFNIYEYDCANREEDKYISITLNGKFSIYYGNCIVYFLKV